MSDTPLTERTGRAILDELQAIRANQEARMTAAELAVAGQAGKTSAPPKAPATPGKSSAWANARDAPGRVEPPM